MFKDVTAECTGGGIYVILGELSDGNFFIADNWSVRILNEDPREDEDEAFYPEWQEERLVRDLEDESQEVTDFIRGAVDWIKEHRPDGNYSISELENIVEDLEQ